MKIAIGCDHGGFELKESRVPLLEGVGYTVIDVGCHSAVSVDYPDFADAVCQKVMAGEAKFGILICGTGIGMSMAANRHRSIRAAVCCDEYSARMSREHNNANVLCLGARVVGPGLAQSIADVWINTDFAGGRHLRRVEKFSD